MKKSVTRTVRSSKMTLEGDQWVSIVNPVTKYTNDARVSRLECDGVLEIPRTPYKVIYTLNKDGRYIADDVHSYLIREFNQRAFVYVCFLPNEWAGLRFNRKVVLL